MSAEPARKIHFFVCTNRRDAASPLPCCAARNSENLLLAFQKELARRRYPGGVKVSGSTCLTTCQHGPTVVVYPDAIWYRNVSESDVGELLDVHLAGDGPLKRLLLPSDVRVW